MAPTSDAAARLWAALEELGDILAPDGRTIRVVRVTLEDGAVLDVFRAEPVEAAMVAWRVRGFCGDGVRLAAILGTKDGRALVTGAVPAASDDDASPLAGVVADVAPAVRDIADLSAAIAKAVRDLMT